jgi:hypothetical protein
MKTLLRILSVLALLIVTAVSGLAVLLRVTEVAARDLPPLKTGDIVFQDAGGEQGMAIMLATHSPYTHVGLIELDKRGRPMVVEAARHVRTVPLDRWIKYGTLKRITVKRIKGLSERDALNAVARAHAYDGRPYDFYFYEARDQIYCSELVYAAFKEGTGITVGKVERVRDLAIDSRAVRAVIEDRWKRHPLCQSGANTKFEACHAAILDQTLVTPASIARDPQMEDVYSNFGIAGE